MDQGAVRPYKSPVVKTKNQGSSRFLGQVSFPFGISLRMMIPPPLIPGLAFVPLESVPLFSGLSLVTK